MEGNPYQAQLVQHLRRIGAEVDQLAVLVPLPRQLHRYDVVHLHWLHFFYRGGYAITRWFRALRFFLRLHRARRAGTRVIWTLHNLEAHDRADPLLDRWLTRTVARWADTVLVHCDWAARALQTEFPWLSSARVAVIPHGHYRDLYTNIPERGTARRELGLPDSGPVFLFLGYIRPNKGVLELIDAFRTLPAERGVRLLIVGKVLDDALEQDIRQRCCDDPSIALHLGFVPEARIPTYFAACDFNVLPYLNITTSGVAVLGMGFARALIAPRIGCFPDVLDAQGAVLYNSGPDALAEALKEALERLPESAAMGRHNLEKVAPWTWSAIAEATLGLYQGRGV